MPRRPRFAVTDFPLHVVQRGNDRGACFFDDIDYVLYLRALRGAAAHYRVHVHAYVLMTNHVHLLVTPLKSGAVSRLMQSVGARYVRHVNDARPRTGTLWEGRYKACLVARDEHVLAACRYIDLNPVRAGIVTHPMAYPWSSHAVLTGARSDPWIVPHPALEQLGRAVGPAYSAWCAQGSPALELEHIRGATASELAFGGDAFKREIEAATGRRVRPSPQVNGHAQHAVASRDTTSDTRRGRPTRARA